MRGRENSAMAINKHLNSVTLFEDDSHIKKNSPECVNKYTFLFYNFYENPRTINKPKPL